MTPLPTPLAAAPDAAIADRLAAYAKAADGAFAENTLRALRVDLAGFAAWAAARGAAVLPAAPETVAAYVDALAETRKPATVARAVASLNHLHRAAGLAPPGQAEAVRLALRRMRRAKGVRQAQAAPLGFAQLRAILARLRESPAELRDAALLAVAYDTLARRSELAALDVADIDHAEDGSGTALLRRSKTDQEGEGRVAYLSADTMRRHAVWVDAGGIGEGAVFRPLGPAARGDRLRAEDIARIFRRRAARAGLDASAVSGHSTRVGAAQDALAHNLGISAIQQAGGWASPRMPARYGEKLEARRSAAAQLAAIQGR